MLCFVEIEMKLQCVNVDVVQIGGTSKNSASFDFTMQSTELKIYRQSITIYPTESKQPISKHSSVHQLAECSN